MFLDIGQFVICINLLVFYRKCCSLIGLATYYLCNKLTSVFLCVCSVIDHEFRHHFVKVAVDPRGDSRVDPQTTLTML